MFVRWLIAVTGFCAFLELPLHALPQNHSVPSDAPPAALETSGTPILEEVRFAGLRRIAPAAVAAQISSHAGERFDAARIDKDIRALARLGWFDSIRVEEIPSTAPSARAFENQKRIALVFHVQERPFLSKVEYSGSRLLSQKQIEKMLEAKKLALGLGKPADTAAFQRIAWVIRSGLNELGHPDASVRIRREEARNATVTVRFEINDGPLLRVRRVNFEGNPQFSSKLLRSQMRSIAPWKPFASWRAKNAYTPVAFEEDRARILAYYQNHGYPEARIGAAQVSRFNERTRRWLPWPYGETRSGLSVLIPMEAGPFYSLESIEATTALQHAVEERSGKPLMFPKTEKGGAYSQQEIDKLRRFWTAGIQPKDSKVDSIVYRSVEVNPSFDPDNNSVRVTLNLSDTLPYLIRRIEFQGLHKFSDRYVRRRILLREGHPVDERALEAGLLRLARTGYFKPIHKEDIHIRFDDANHTANVSIHLEEIGQQRASLVGGHGQFGSTLGIAYTVFDLLNREELLSSQIEGGSESLRLMLGLAKEGIFGTRASLAFSVFNNVLRPRFARSAQGPFFSSHSEGINVPWTYALTNTDSLGVNYTLSRTTTEYPAALPPAATGVTVGDVRSRISSRTLGVGWARDTGNERVLFSDSASGGWLGGGENMVRSSGEYAHIFRDPIFAPSDAWAFRTTFSGAGSYRGDMPLYSRFFSGDEFVRGLRQGDLGPYALTSKMTPSGATIPSASPAGANLLGAANTEYRVPLGGGTEAAGFFDFGTGWLLPNWLGPTKPLLLRSTNGVLHGSTGVELRWTVPEVQVPVRAYYAFNVLRLDHPIALSAKSRFLARNRFSAFGWGLGALF